MSFDQVRTLIIGGGQAGLAMSHMLSRRRCPQRLVERGRIAERSRSERWEGPVSQLIGAASPLANDDSDVVRCGVEVTTLRRGSRGFIAETAEGHIEAAHIVVATGPLSDAGGAGLVDG